VDSAAGAVQVVAASVAAAMQVVAAAMAAADTGKLRGFSQKARLLRQAGLFRCDCIVWLIVARTVSPTSRSAVAWTSRSTLYVTPTGELPYWFSRRGTLAVERAISRSAMRSAATG